MFKAKEKKPAPTEVNIPDTLHSSIASYKILKFIGEGTFGKVAKCVNVLTHETVAIKIHKDMEDHIIEKEVDMLKAIGALDPDKNNIVRFMDSFSFCGHSCLAFEMLDKSLWKLMEMRRWEPLSLHEIRPVTQQLLVAFDALQSIGIMHADLKPDNIMLVNHMNQPFKIKLIDFGLALPVSQAKLGMKMQALSYRAPEVILGLPLSEAVDMWGVGCIMAFLYFGINLFPNMCALDNMKAICHLVGQPGDDQLCAAKNAGKYFTFVTGLGWRLKTPAEYEKITGLKPHLSWRSFDMARDLDDAVLGYPLKKGNITYEDMMAFVSLLRFCLHPDAGQRITPREALSHGFITGVHLVDETDTGICASVAVQNAPVSSSHSLEKSYYSYEEVLAFSESLAWSLNMAPMSDMQEVPSTASYHEKDSLTDSFGGNTAHLENSSSEFVSEEDSAPESSSDRHSSTEISSHEDSPPAKEESVTAAPINNENINTDCLPIASNTCGRASADIGPTDGAAAVTRPVDADNANTGADGPRRMTLWRRTRKFFGRLRKRVVSICKRQTN